MDCVKPLQLQPSMKLALMAFADSAGDRQRVAYPGLEGVMKWACVSRSQASSLIADLVEAGYLRKHLRGQKGRNARYVVFPDGCCTEHGAAPATGPDAGVLEVAAALGVDLTEAQLVMLHGLAGHGPADRHHTPSTGAGAPESVSVSGSGPQDPVPDDESDTPAPAPKTYPETADPDPSGATQGPADRHRLLSFSTTPQPHASVGSTCPAHDTPHPRCRGCGTTPRQLRDAARRGEAAAAAQRRLDEQAARAAAPPPAVDRTKVATLVDDTRRKIRSR